MKLKELKEAIKDLPDNLDVEVELYEARYNVYDVDNTSIVFTILVKDEIL